MADLRDIAILGLAAFLLGDTLRDKTKGFFKDIFGIPQAPSFSSPDIDQSFENIDRSLGNIFGNLDILEENVWRQNWEIQMQRYIEEIRAAYPGGEYTGPIASRPATPEEEELIVRGELPTTDEGGYTPPIVYDGIVIGTPPPDYTPPQDGFDIYTNPELYV